MWIFMQLRSIVHHLYGCWCIEFSNSATLEKGVYREEYTAIQGRVAARETLAHSKVNVEI